MIGTRRRLLVERGRAAASSALDFARRRRSMMMGTGRLLLLLVKDVFFTLVSDLPDAVPSVGVARDDKLSVDEIGVVIRWFGERELFRFHGH